MQLSDLRLVLVEGPVGGKDLVSLALRLVLASGDDLDTGLAVPRFYFGEAQEREANVLAGHAWVQDWPGWDAIYNYLDTKTPV